jgi:hypothetical protein
VRRSRLLDRNLDERREKLGKLRGRKNGIAVGSQVPT